MLNISKNKNEYSTNDYNFHNNLGKKYVKNSIFTLEDGIRLLHLNKNKNNESNKLPVIKYGNPQKKNLSKNILNSLNNFNSDTIKVKTIFNNSILHNVLESNEDKNFEKLENINFDIFEKNKKLFLEEDKINIIRLKNFSEIYEKLPLTTKEHKNNGRSSVHVKKNKSSFSENNNFNYNYSKNQNNLYYTCKNTFNNSKALLHNKELKFQLYKKNILRDEKSNNLNNNFDSKININFIDDPLITQGDSCHKDDITNKIEENINNNEDKDKNNYNNNLTNINNFKNSELNNDSNFNIDDIKHNKNEVLNFEKFQKINNCRILNRKNFSTVDECFLNKIKDSDNFDVMNKNDDFIQKNNYNNENNNYNIFPCTNIDNTINFNKQSIKTFNKNIYEIHNKIITNKINDTYQYSNFVNHKENNNTNTKENFNTSINNPPNSPKNNGINNKTSYNKIKHIKYSKNVIMKKLLLDIVFPFNSAKEGYNSNFKKFQTNRNEKHNSKLPVLDYKL